MISIALHLVLPMFFYTMITTLAYAGFEMGALEATALSALLATPVLYGVYAWDQKKRKITPAVSLRLGGSFGYIVIFGVCLCILGNLLIECTGLTETSQTYRDVSQSLYSPALFIQIVSSGFLIPAAEELIFRGMAFAPLRDQLPFLPAAALSALLFGLFHGNLPQGVYAFILGLALAWLYENCKTLTAPYFFHVSANLFAICMTNTKFFDSLLSGEQKTTTAIVTAVSAALSFVCVMRISLKNSNKEETA